MFTAILFGSAKSLSKNENTWLSEKIDNKTFDVCCEDGEGMVMPKIIIIERVQPYHFPPLCLLLSLCLQNYF